MNMTSLQREYLFLLVFQRDFYTNRQMLNQVDNCIHSIELAETINYEISQDFDKDIKIASQNFEKFLELKSKVDEILVRNLKNWKLGRIGKIELALLRVAVYEIIFMQEKEYKFVFNDLIILSKSYTNVDSHKFLNGVLSNIYKNEIIVDDEVDEEGD